MKVKDVLNFIDQIAPFNTQMEFDNAGLIIGDSLQEVKNPIVALDIRLDVIKKAISIGSNLIITHHPVIFDPLKEIKANSLVFKLIKAGIAVISAHTNLDMAKDGVNDFLASTIGLKNITPVIPLGDCFEARIGSLETEQTAEEFAKALNKKLNTRVKYTGNGKIKTVGLCSGSGGDLINEMLCLNVDAFVTADVKHSVFITADTNGLILYDCGHFETENIIVTPLANKLSLKFNTEFLPYTKSIIKYE